MKKNKPITNIRFTFLIPNKIWDKQFYDNIRKEIESNYKSELVSRNRYEGIIETILKSMTDSTFVIRFMKRFAKIYVADLSGSFVIPHYGYQEVHFMTKDDINEGEIFAVKRKCNRKGINLNVNIS